MKKNNHTPIKIPLELAQFRYTLLPENEILIPFDKRGNILRGAFGSSLRSLVCFNPNLQCGVCVERNNCAYFLIFAPSGLSQAKRLRDTPRGFVIKYTLEKRAMFTDLYPFILDFLLIGNRIMYHPWVIVPMQALGSKGIGLGRGKFTVSKIEAVKNDVTLSIFDARSNTVANKSLIINERDFSNECKKLSSNSVTIEFLTPTRIRYNPTGIKGKSELVHIPEFHHLLKRLRDRINALSQVYGNGGIACDFKGIGERAEKVKIKSAHTRWIEVRRRSRTSGAWHDLSGFVGTITYEGNIKEFLPFLVVGQYIHVGENAVFGNGWYRIIK